MKVQRVLYQINEKGQWDEPDDKIRFAGFVKSEVTQDIDGVKSTMKIEYASYIVPVKENATPKAAADKQ